MDPNCQRVEFAKSLLPLLHEHLSPSSHASNAQAIKVLTVLRPWCYACHFCCSLYSSSLGTLIETKLTPCCSGGLLTASCLPLSPDTTPSQAFALFVPKHSSEDRICKEVRQCFMHFSPLIQTLPLELAHCQNYSFTWDSWVVSRDNSRRISVTGSTAWMCSAHFWIKRAHLHLSLVKKKSHNQRQKCS